MASGDDDAPRAARAAARRARMVISRSRPGEEDPDFARVRGLEAMALTAELSAAAWSLSGRPVERNTLRSGPIVRVPRKP